MAVRTPFAGTLIVLLFVCGCQRAEPLADPETADRRAPAEAAEAAEETGASLPAATLRAVGGARVASSSAEFKRPPPQPLPGDIDRDEYPDEEPNPVKRVSEDPVSTFSIDVDTASYANVRRFLNDGHAPPTDAVRIEEIVNYFDYDYPLPDSRDKPFSVSTSVTPSPWNAHTRLIHVGLKGYDVEPDRRPRANLVFLIDVSGSMDYLDKLPLAKKALRLLVERLNDDDTVSIVVYAGAAGAVLEPTTGAEKDKILAALGRLAAGGSTAGGEGLRLAYSFAESNFDEHAINRVILATDGDFNVGIVDDERLEDFVAAKRETGIYLSILGFGRGNYNDALMQTIAQAGNGTAAYIDTLKEARKVLHDEMQSALFPIANDVKIQVEFNPARVAEYRLIGYETRRLRREDFSNDKVDAGDIGAGHEVTAIYEIAAPGSKGLSFEERRYAEASAPNANARFADEFAFLRIRYKLPGETDSRLIERPISDRDAIGTLAQASTETRFAVAAAGFAQLLRGEPYLHDFGFGEVVELAQGARDKDEFGYRAEFIQLARLAETAEALPELPSPHHQPQIPP